MKPIPRKSQIYDILQNKREEIRRHKKACPLSRLRKEIAEQEFKPGLFEKALRSGGFSVIAEIKKKSPSHGDLVPRLDVRKVAREYDKVTRISCISMLTDEKYFGCNLDDMKKVRSETSKPILRKDFILDEYQIYEARACGADAVLLIARFLAPDQIERFVKVTRRLGMEPFVEYHKGDDFGSIGNDVSVVGINTRDLTAQDLRKTQKTDLNIVKVLLPFVPEDKIVVAESGVKTSKDMLRLHELGRVDAVLVGAHIIKQENKLQAIKELFSLIPWETTHEKNNY